MLHTCGLLRRVVLARNAHCERWEFRQLSQRPCHHCYRRGPACVGCLPPRPNTPRPPSLPRSAILPVASAFATTGAVLGIIIALVVGATNVYTCTLLIRGAQYTGTRDYESFSHAVGGPWYKVRVRA